MFGVKIRRIRSVWCFISIINQRILTSAGSQPPSQRGRMALKALPADKKQESGESWMPRVWFEKLFWGPSGPSPIISPTSHPFSLYKQVKNKPVSQWDAPHRWELRLLTKFPGCIPGTCPPLRFYNTLHLHKVLLGNKKKKKSGACKWVTSEKNPATGFLLLSRFGLIHYTATGSEQRHLWAPLYSDS